MRDVALPTRTRSARLLELAAGDEMRDLDSDGVIARVDLAEIVRRDGRRLARVTVTGVVCQRTPGADPDASAIEWTAELDVSVRVARTVRVFLPQVRYGGRHDERPRTLFLGASFALLKASWNA